MSSLRHHLLNKVGRYLENIGFHGLLWRKHEPEAQEAKDRVMTTTEKFRHDVDKATRKNEVSSDNDISVKTRRSQGSRDSLLFDFFDRNLKSEDYRNMIHKVEKDAK